MNILNITKMILYIFPILSTIYDIFIDLLWSISEIKYPSIMAGLQSRLLWRASAKRAYNAL